MADPKRTKVYPIPGTFIPGVPALETEFESKAEADDFMKGETSGVKHAAAFTLTRAEANEAALAPTADEQ
jgi:hypothetical protein